jgi:pilus assembly protein CpaE
MSVQSDADYFRRAMLSGARDFLMKPFSADELISAVRSVHESRPKLAQPEPAYSNGAPPKQEVPEATGKLIAVYSPKGGTGASTVAVNLAVFLAKQRQRTVLIDGNFQFGDVAVMLNLKTSTTILDLLDRIEDLDADLVNSVAATHKTGLRILTAPARPEMAELVTPSRLAQLLTILLNHYDFIVVDADSSLTEATLAVLDGADSVVLVTQPRLASLKNASLFLDLVRGLGYAHDKVALVVNQSKNDQKVSVSDIESILKQKALATLPDDDQYATQAADQGYPLVYGPAQKRPIAAALRELGAELLRTWHPVVELEQESSTPIRLSRLFGGR